MNKDEMKMIEDIAKTISDCSMSDCVFCNGRHKCIYYKSAESLYNAGYRKVGEDEIVESMKTYESARQETAREILQRFYNRAKSNKNDFADVNSYEIELMAEEFGIELE